MPHVAFVCPDPEMPPAVGVQDCLSCARTRVDRACPWNHTLLKLMVDRVDDRISPTRLAQCPRQVALKRRYDYALDPAVQFPSARGTIFHKGLELLAGEDGGLTEVELERDFHGTTIQGRLDLVYPDLGLLVDYKTVPYIAAGGRTKKDGTLSQATTPSPDHIAQLSVYAWLCRDGLWVNRPDPLRVQWPIAAAEVVFLDMGKSRRVGVQLWDQAQVERYLAQRVPLLQQAYLRDSLLPPVLDPEDPDFYQCERCPVQDICHQLEEEEHV